MFRKLQDAEARRTLTIYVDGKSVSASEGETIAGVLLRHAPLLTRNTPVSGALRAPYCMMGVCFECLAVVDGVPSCQTCLTIVSDGMCVERQDGRREVCVRSVGVARRDRREDAHEVVLHGTGQDVTR